VPSGALALVVALAFDRRTAGLVAVVMAAIVASLQEFDLVLLSVLMARGLAATIFYFDRKHPRQMILSGLLGGLSSAAVYAALLSAFEGRFDLAADLSNPLSSEILSCVGGGLSAGLLATVLRPQADLLLGNVSRERLLDLTDLSQPLLVKLAKEAPGTFEHTRAMANLAEQASSAIGADALLTRVGAYYHDVGKTAHPKHFVENLQSDEKSPHQGLAPEESAQVIIDHVVTGTRMLRKAGIPEAVIEFAYTHHGTSVIEFFWNKCLELGNPTNLPITAFTYPGMKPQTKETAILMLVDSIEAASRTVDRPTRDQFAQLIQRIVFTKMEQGQLDECGLDLAELRVITTRLTDTLVSMYHHRIKYQWQVERAEEFGVPSRAVRAAAPVLHVTPVPPTADTLASVLHDGRPSSEVSTVRFSSERPPADRRNR
jgi:putative nucleotidyltransferase with HDIG domain